MSEEYLSSVSPGVVLQQARESLGLTQREVADALHLPPGTIDAVERGDKSRLPDYVFTRGYIRSYAKLLELDADGLVAALALDYGEVSQRADEERAQTQAVAARPVTVQELLARPAVWLSAAGVLVALVVLMLILGPGEDTAVPGTSEAMADTAPADPKAASTAAPTQAQPSVSAPISARDDADSGAVAELSGDSSQMPDETSDGATEAGQVWADPGAESVDAAAQATEAVDLATDPSGMEIDSPDTRRLTPDGQDRVLLSFSDDCWVEIKDVAGNTLFSDLGKAGQSLDFAGAGPFRVLLGYAPGVELRFNGEILALNPHTRNNVASLVIGQ